MKKATGAAGILLGLVMISTITWQAAAAMADKVVAATPKAGVITDSIKTELTPLAKGGPGAAAVFPSNWKSQLQYVHLKNLKMDGTLKGKTVQVHSNCAPNADVYEPDNNFVYDPGTERIKFDQANMYYYGELGTRFIGGYAPYFMNQKTAPASDASLAGRSVVSMPLLMVTLCSDDQTLKPPGATIHGNWQLHVSCYDQATCDFVGMEYSPKNLANAAEVTRTINRDFGIVLHELTHAYYVTYAKKDGIRPTVQDNHWQTLNDAYAIYFPRLIAGTGSMSDYGDLNNNEIFNPKRIMEEVPGEIAFNPSDLRSYGNKLAIGGALWDASQDPAIGHARMNELVARSWRLLYQHQDQIAPVAALLALTDAAIERFGMGSSEQIAIRDALVKAFQKHGIECEGCQSSGAATDKIVCGDHKCKLGIEDAADSPLSCPEDCD